MSEQVLYIRNLLCDIFFWHIYIISMQTFTPMPNTLSSHPLRAGFWMADRSHENLFLVRANSHGERRFHDTSRGRREA
jgi:hypothetical protein